jgi:Protein of unknown function (DUF3261)
MKRALAAAASCVLFAACGPSVPPKAAEAPAYSWRLRPPSVRRDDFLDRQSIAATYGDRSARFEAVLQKRGDELTLLGLTPFGSRAFVVRQMGLDVTFQSFVPQSLPFPPNYILFDVQRVFFASEDTGDGGVVDGEHESVRDGEAVHEEWRAGRLLRRTFRRVDGRPAGLITVVYDGGMALDGAPPAHVTFDNGWYGYRLEITTLSHQPL